MNRNPFVPTPGYNSQQPPLPPGPPPPQPAQPDYSAYWAATAAAQHAQVPAAGAYNPQWPTSQPATQATARPTPEQSALYANYGYGGQQNQSWQHQQRQTQTHFQPPPPVVQPPPPPPPQPAYNPYQPQAGAYQQPYVPQGAPAQQVTPAPYQPQVVAPQFQQPQQPFFQQQQQQQRQNVRNNVHHPSPQQFPPAKRQRFDGPNQHRGPPPQPQFQPPPPPSMQQQGGMYGQSQGSFSRGGGPTMGQMAAGAGRGGFNQGRGGGNTGNRGRGGPMGMNRGGNRGGRGGSSYNNMGSRGGGSGQSGGSFRGHNSNRGFGNRDNRRGGSFNAGGNQNYSHGHQQHQQHHHHQQQSFSGSSRGRNQGFSYSQRGGRHDSASVTSTKENGNVFSSFGSGKKDENRRTLTDFKIVGLEIPELAWTWGLPISDSAESAVKTESVENTLPSEMFGDSQAVAETSTFSAAVADVTSTADTQSVDASSKGVTDASVESISVKTEGTALNSPPPSRIRIYFHTPVTADDSHPLNSQPSVSLGPSSLSGTRKGKRKKLEDDDGDLEDGRGPPPPPPHLSGMNSEHDGASMDRDGTETATGRGSAAPSVAETASEGDWLMAAIGEDEGENGESEHLHAHELDSHYDENADEGHYGNGYGDMHDDGQHDYAMMGDDHAHDQNGPNADHAATASAAFPSNGPNAPDNVPQHGSSDVADAAPQPQGNGSDAGPGAQAVHETGPSAAEGNTVISSNQSTPNDIAAAVPASATSVVALADLDSHTGDQTSTEHSSNSISATSILRATDSIATIPDSDINNNVSPNEPTLLDVNAGHEGYEATEQVTQVEEQYSQYSHYEHYNGQETPVPSSTTAISSQTGTSVFGDLPQPPSEATTSKTPSANRLSVSYAAGTRRMVIDAEIVDKLKVFRADGRIEVSLNVEEDEPTGYKGILMEAYSEATSSYIALEWSEALESDPTIPPFFRATLPSKMTLLARLDKERPLSEPRWVKTGDVQDWLRSMFGRMFWVAGDAADGWEKKIEVVDPDPAPTIWTVLEAWATNSSVGLPNERQRFVRTHMTETDNILEILLRLVRGERSTFNQNNPTVSAPTVTGPLLSALSQGSAHGAQQNHVSLAVLAIFRLAVEYAKKAVPETGKAEAEERVGEIIRSLPSHLVYKSLDGIFKEWKVEKKGGRS
ncbi:hypothetical protein OBBRIDRAFT_883479 [Obba rivulosa]|uniref:Uncharacterized protein n=1 Tax=Obba rivulosa TaxID=1052685 RepID=A0A8E2J6R6_9APHY|nr:hypothetical protein OBBRIDRAFT_883479 [Obba rivulosa]